MLRDPQGDFSSRWLKVSRFSVFQGLQGFTGFCLRSVCRVIAALCGLFLMTLGFLFCLTLVGALIGVPMITVGFLLIVRRLI